MAKEDVVDERLFQYTSVDGVTAQQTWTRDEQRAAWEA